MKTRDEKIYELEALSYMISDFIKDKQENDSKSLRIGDSHHILWSGNPDANIMIVQMHPDIVEVNWAKRYNTHKIFVCTGSNSRKIRKSSRQAGFNTFEINKEEYQEYNDKEDFFYVNYIPFYPIAGSSFPEKTINELKWIFGSIREIISPLIITTLGYDVFSRVAMYCDRTLFWALCEDAEPKRGADNVFYLPLEDPKIVSSETLTKNNKAFSLALKRLYTKRQFYIGNNNED